MQGFFAYHFVPNDAAGGRLGYPSVVPWHAYKGEHGLSKHYEPEVVCESESVKGKRFKCVVPFQVTKEVRERRSRERSRVSRREF